MQYKIISSFNEDYVSEEVTKLLNKNWQLLGNLNVCTDSSRAPKYTQVLINVELVKYKPLELKPNLAEYLVGDK